MTDPDDDEGQGNTGWIDPGAQYQAYEAAMAAFYPDDKIIPLSVWFEMSATSRQGFLALMQPVVSAVPVISVVDAGVPTCATNPMAGMW